MDNPAGDGLSLSRRAFLLAGSAAALAAAAPPPLAARTAGGLAPWTDAAPDQASYRPPTAPPRSLPAPARWQVPGQRPAPSPPNYHDRYRWQITRGYPVRF